MDTHCYVYTYIYNYIYEVFWNGGTPKISLINHPAIVEAFMQTSIYVYM